MERRNKEKAEEEAEAATKANANKGERMESCSCIEGNPCADAYCCKVNPQPPNPQTLKTPKPQNEQGLIMCVSCWGLGFGV